MKGTFMIFRRFFDIRDWWYVIGLTLLGISFCSQNLNPSTVMMRVFLSALFLASGYSLNRRFEELNNRNSRQDMSRLDSFLEFLLPLILLVIISSYIYNLFWLVLAGIAISLAYSSPQLNLKSTPYVGELLNSTGFTIVFLIGYAGCIITTVKGILLFLFIALTVLAAHLIHEIAHGKDDKRAGVNNIYQSHGIKAALLIVRTSLILITILALMISVETDVGLHFFALTGIFSAIFMMCLRGLDFKSNIIVDAEKIRLNIRALCILYGLTLLTLNIYYLPLP
jgi:4-hydroxybenzoate polyprenyltransferase